MPDATVTLYNDYKSPYGFVAKAAAYAIEDRYGITLDWLPYTLDIPSYLGSVENRSEHQWRRVKYSYMDARRFANQQGLTLKGPKAIYDTRTAQTGMLFAKAHGMFRAYNDAVFERFWSHGIEIEDVAAIEAALAEAGAPAEAFRGYLDGDGGAEHDRIRTEAEARGVFGVPTFIFDDEMFWGGDRIPLLEERLTAAGLGPTRDSQA